MPRKVREDGNNFVLGKNGGQMPSSLSYRLIAVVRQADKTLAVYKIFEIRQLQFLSTFRLFEWIYGANSFVHIDKQRVFKGNVGFSDKGSHILHVNPYYYKNYHT